VLELSSSDPLQPTLPLCLTGVGSNARIDCSPAHLDFGPVALGTSVSLPFRSTNAGEPEVSSDPLRVVGLRTDHERFRATLRNPDGSIDAKPEGYAPGESFFVDVTYSPADETGDEGKVSIDNSTAEPSLALPLSRRG